MAVSAKLTRQHSELSALEMFAAADDIIVNRNCHIQLVTTPIEACDFSQLTPYIGRSQSYTAIHLHAKRHAQCARPTCRGHEKYVTENQAPTSTCMVKWKRSTTARWDTRDLFSDVPDGGKFGKELIARACHLWYNSSSTHSSKTTIVEVLYAKVAIVKKVKAKYEGIMAQYPENYLAIYDVPLDKDTDTLDHYPSVWMGKEEFE